MGIYPTFVAALPFIFLNSQGVIKMGDTPFPYGAYAMIGTMIWQVFVDALISPLQAVQSSAAMLTRINFPREGPLLAGLMQVGLSFLVRLLLVALVLLVYGIVPPATVILFPFGSPRARPYWLCSWPPIDPAWHALWRYPTRNWHTRALLDAFNARTLSNSQDGPRSTCCVYKSADTACYCYA